MHSLIRGFIFFSVLLFTLAGCGVTSTARYEPISNCWLEKPIPITSQNPSGITLTQLEFYSDIQSVSIQNKIASEISLYTVALSGTPQPLLLGYQVSPGKFGSGISANYNGIPTPSEIDEENFTHFALDRRDINGRVRVEGEQTTYKTRLLEFTSDPKSDKAIATSLRVVVEKNEIKAVEMNWPVTNSEDWREGDLLLPKLKTWEWETHPGTNENLCLKKAVLKTR